MIRHAKIFLAVLLLSLAGALPTDLIDENVEELTSLKDIEIEVTTTTTPYDTTTINEDSCEYDGRWYGPGEEVTTHEPCLSCTCLGASLVCHLRVCPNVPETVPQGCYRLKKAGKCCDEIVCEDEFGYNRLYRRETELEKIQEDEAAGLQDDETARLQDASALAAIIGTRRRGGLNATNSDTRRDDASTTTTTTTSRTPRDCEVNGVRHAEGSLVEGFGGECENCYCLNGEVTCTKTTCAPPLDGCKPVMQDGHCCPVKYDCDDGHRRVSVDQFFKDFPVKISSANQRKESERMRPEWQTNIARKSPAGSITIVDTPPAEAPRKFSLGTETETKESPDETVREQSPSVSERERPQLRSRVKPFRRLGPIIRKRKITPLKTTPDETSDKSPPAEETAQEESLTDSKDNEPTAEATNQEPTAEVINQEPTAEVTNQEPTAEATNQEPTAEATNQEPTANVTNQEEPQANRSSSRKRFSTLISRPSREEIANRRKESRYSNRRRPPSQRPRPQTQSLSFRFRQRIKLEKEKNNKEQSNEPASTSSSTTPTTTTTTSTTTTTPSTTTTTPSTTTTTPSTTTTPFSTLPPTLTTSSTATLLASESTTKSLPATTQRLITSTTPEDDLNTITEFDTTIYGTEFHPTTYETEFYSTIYDTELDSTIHKETEPVTTELEDKEFDSTIHVETEPVTTDHEDKEFDSTIQVQTEPVTTEYEDTKIDSTIHKETEPVTTEYEDTKIDSTIHKETEPVTTEYEDTELDSTMHKETEPVTTEYEDTTLAYGPVPGIFDRLITAERPADAPKATSGDPFSQTTTPSIPTQEPLPEEILSTIPPSDIATTMTPLVSSSKTSSTTTTTAATTTSSITTPTTTMALTTSSTTPIPTTTENYDDPIPETSRYFPSSTTVPQLLNEEIEIGTGVNVKGNLDDVVAFGPILIYDNRVRRLIESRKKAMNGTEEDLEVDEGNTVVTDMPEETTVLIRDETTNDEKTYDDELLTDYDAGTEEVTTLFSTPLVQETTVKSLSELLSSATAASTIITTEPPSSDTSPINDAREEPIYDIEYTDTETNFPSYDITVSTSVLATNQPQPPAAGVGEVIAVDLKPEHKTPEIGGPPEANIEHTSLFGTLLNMFTRPKPPQRLPPPPTPPSRLPFRPRPNERPTLNGRPRPGFIPPRFRFTTPSAVALEKGDLEQPSAASQPGPIIIPTTVPSILLIPTSQPTNVINRPAPGLTRPKPIINIPVHSSNQPEVIPNRPDFLPEHPVAIAPQTDSSNGLPSKPVIEGGFQAMRDNPSAIHPIIDSNDYDDSVDPTLPPSLPNLKIIPFVAADALVNQEIGIGGDEFKTPPLLLPDNDDDVPENQTPKVTTEATTTTRRPFSRLPIGDRRPPILPPRRTIAQSGDVSSTRRPFLPSRRPLRPFSSKPSTTSSTTTTDAPENEEEPISVSKPKFRPDVAFTLRERHSTRPPFIPPRRFTPSTDKPTTPNPTTTTTTITTTTQPTTTRPTTRRPLITTPRPIESDDIANLLLQDVFGKPAGQNTPPVRFTPTRTTIKPIIPVKISTALPEIPSAVRDQLPLATDPILASGLLKLSGCNIYGRMYDVDETIKELSAACKQCRCTPVGVQCLPIC